MSSEADELDAEMARKFSIVSLSEQEFTDAVEKQRTMMDQNRLIMFSPPRRQTLPTDVFFSECADDSDLPDINDVDEWVSAARDTGKLDMTIGEFCVSIEDLLCTEWNKDVLSETCVENDVNYYHDNGYSSEGWNMNWRRNVLEVHKLPFSCGLLLELVHDCSLHDDDISNIARAAKNFTDYCAKNDINIPRRVFGDDPLFRDEKDFVYGHYHAREELAVDTDTE